MPASDEAIRRYSLLLRTYRRRTSALLVAAWDALDGYDEQSADEYARNVSPALTGAKTAAVAASSGFFALALGIRPVSIRARDVLVEPRIRDPFLALWHASKEGRPLEEALTAGRSQAEAVGADFVQKTARRTGDTVAAASDVTVRWRRVPDANACNWCKTVAGQLYHTAESADFGHDRDGCVVVPVEGRRKDSPAAGEPQGITRTVSRGSGRRATRTSTPASNARDRADNARRELLTERDPARRARLEERVRRWDEKADAFQARDGR